MTSSTAPKLKVYAADNAASFVPRELAALAGFPDHVRQGTILVRATSKANAIDHLALVRIRATSTTLRVAGGNDIGPLLDAGLFPDDGDVIVYEAMVRDTPIVCANFMQRSTSAGWVVGHWRYRTDVGPGRSGLLLERATDRALFPTRGLAQPPTPATGWTPVGEILTDGPPTDGPPASRAERVAALSAEIDAAAAILDGGTERDRMTGLLMRQVVGIIEPEDGRPLGLLPMRVRVRLLARAVLAQPREYGVRLGSGLVITVESREEAVRDAKPRYGGIAVHRLADNAWTPVAS